MSEKSKMQPRDIVLAVIGRCSDHEEFGRTSLQKVSYLVSLILGEDLGHRAYYYGPYSSNVEADAEALVLGALVHETIEPLGVNNRGYAINRYSYRLTDTGKDRMSRVAAAHPDQFDELSAFIARIESVVGSLEQGTLSSVAKTLYIAREQRKPLTTEEVKKLAKDLGWNLPEQKIRQVVEMLSELGLVTVENK